MLKWRKRAAKKKGKRSKREIDSSVSTQGSVGIDEMLARELERSTLPICDTERSNNNNNRDDYEYMPREFRGVRTNEFMRLAHGNRTGLLCFFLFFALFIILDFILCFVLFVHAEVL